METKLNSNLSINVNLSNDFIKKLRELKTPDVLKNKIILIYLAKYDKKNMFFLDVLNSNNLGVSLANYISSNEVSKLSTIDEPFPTEKNKNKLILIPAPNNFTVNTGVWELFISNIDMNDYKQLLFNSRKDLFLYYQKAVDSNFYNNNYLNHYSFIDNTGIGLNTYTKLDDPETYDIN